jgi:hypothetical protein
MMISRSAQNPNLKFFSRFSAQKRRALRADDHLRAARPEVWDAHTSRFIQTLVSELLRSAGSPR